ncbi:hypothetical protein [Phenylobacterium sp.]
MTRTHSLIGYEEPALSRSVPEQYGPYFANVTRWLPRLRPWKG